MKYTLAIKKYINFITEFQEDSGTDMLDKYVQSKVLFALPHRSVECHLRWQPRQVFLALTYRRKWLR